MKNVLLALFVTLSSLVYADCFEKDDGLVAGLKSKNLRLVVLCNFQGLNNQLDIVTSNPTPGYALTNQGVGKLQQVKPHLAALNITTIYTPSAFRCQQSTYYLGSAFALPPSALVVDFRLRMQNFGMAEGEDYDIYKSHFLSFEDMLMGTPPDGEDGCSVYNRTRSFLNSLLENHQNETILIITHAFNYCHISNLLTGSFEEVPSPGKYKIYE
jgi:broad specificity phosphatase PhoE